MIEVKNLSVQTSKGVVLLDRVEFTLTPGVCTGLTGASGSGKTTLLKALMGVSDGDVSINSGQILLDGEDLLKKPEKVRRDLCGTTLGFIPQNPMTAFNLHVPVGTQMTETFRKRLRLDKNAARKLSMDVLQKVNLLDTDRVYRSYPSQLSGGMLQRATMAILIGLSPRYIFADEPTSALDEENKEYLIQVLMRMKQQAAILFVSHDDAAIRTLCDDLLVMQSGIIVEYGTTADLFAAPHGRNPSPKCEQRVSGRLRQALSCAKRHFIYMGKRGKYQFYRRKRQWKKHNGPPLNRFGTTHQWRDFA